MIDDFLSFFTIQRFTISKIHVYRRLESCSVETGKLSMMYIVSGFLSKSMDELKREIFWRHWVLWDIVSDPFIHPGGKDDSAQLH